MRFLTALAISFVVLFALIAPTFAQESLHNLPLPRWATLASPEANLRTGPGKRYPIDWVLKKKNLPVEIIQEFDHWRRVREPDGADGWIHKSMLSGVRNSMMKKDVTLYARPATDARAIAVLKEGVIARVVQCQKEWCELAIESFDGWAKKSALWGVYKDETWKD